MGGVDRAEEPYVTGIQKCHLFLCFIQERLKGCAEWLYVNLTQTKLLLEERPSVERMAPADWSVGETVVHFLD